MAANSGVRFSVTRSRRYVKGLLRTDAELLLSGIAVIVIDDIEPLDFFLEVMR